MSRNLLPKYWDTAHFDWIRLFRWLLVMIAVINGCAAFTRQPVAIKPAKPGTAVMYFFRPYNDAVDRSDHPQLSIDEHFVGTLKIGNYTAVSLNPDLHQVSLQASPADSDNWNQRAAFTVEDGGTYYVAIWRQNQHE